MAVITGILFVITLIWRNWIELAFKIELDAGTGSLEWSIVGVLFVVTIALFLLARYQGRVARRSFSEG
jgi:hypothetical protein